MQYRTQKARGLALASSLASRTSPLNTAYPPYVVVDAAEETLDLAQTRNVRAFLLSVAASGKIMVRPAPMSPRHGFVDSRPVPKGLFVDELEIIRQQVLAADPQGEIILMPFIEATHNYIISSAGVTIGTSFDGATSGTNVVFVPASSKLRDYLLKIKDSGADLELSYGIRPGDDAYIEAVTAKGVTQLTQVRAGPLVASTRNYVPEEMLVTRVVVPDTGDLLAWETTAASLKGEAGVVVYHQGGAVSSHFGVHCAINGVAYWTDAEPTVGMTLKATITEQWDDDDYLATAAYISRFSHLNIAHRSDVVEAISVCIATLHAIPALVSAQSDTAHRMVAFALTYFPQLLTALACGEARHTKDQISGVVYQYGLKHMVPHVSRESGRDTVYQNVLSLPFEDMPDLLARCHVLFDAPQWSSSYGGKAWANCTRATLKLLDAVIEFQRSGSQETFASAVTALNVAVNQAHNNGWWLNKYVVKELMDLLALAPALGLAKPLVYRLATEELPERDLSEISLATPLMSNYLARARAEILEHQGRDIGDFPIDDSDDDNDSSSDSDDYDSDDDDDDDGSDSTLENVAKIMAQSVPLTPSASSIQPHPKKILKGLEVHTTSHGHMQIPGSFKNQNRPWGISIDLTGGNKTSVNLRNIIAACFKYAPLVKTLNQGSSTEYMVIRLRREDSQLRVNLYTSASGFGKKSTTIDSKTLGYTLDWDDVPALHPLAHTYGAL